MKGSRGRRRRKRIWPYALAVLLTAAAAFGLYMAFFWNLLPGKSYTAEDFGIETLRSDTDQNQNGVDDYTDILLGARAYVRTKPVYISKYYKGGYPPEGEGVCTDVVWSAFQNAGYSLKDLVDADIAAHPECYPNVKTPDPNIDFRRVRNLKIFFDRHAESLTTDPNEIAQWQPGDIVIYTNHIGIVSDKRNRKGQPYLIHNAGQPRLEENALARYQIVAHYRWTQ